MCLLSNSNVDYIGNGISSIDDANRINTGRPFGGVGIMWRKHLNTYCTFKEYACDRIVGLEINCNSFSLLILCIYLPFDSSENYDDYMFYLAKMLQIVEEFGSPYVYICGDFNANLLQSSRFGKELKQVCRDNSFSISDELLLPADTFTFVSSSHGSTSWLDHVLSTTSGHALVESVHVKTDFVSSDHLPLCFDISIDKEIICTSTSVCSTNDESPSFNWKDLTDNDLLNYSICTKKDLSRIRIPLDALQCNDMSCGTHQKDIDHFYYDIVNTVYGCIRKCIPMKKHNEHSIVGWNEEVKQYHTIARSEFKFWKQNNMPRSGPVFHDMRIARARFKYALRQCRLDEQMIYSNRLAKYMQCHDVNNFWKTINIRNKSKATLSNCIAGTSGETNIANMWKDHYSSLLNSSSNITDKDDVCISFKNMCFNHGMHVSVSEVLDLLRGQPNDKATGMDGLSGESLKFADPILAVLLSICFTCMFKHCYLPSSMLDSVIVPLVKNRNGDLSDKNNYRPIALSSTISKVFENVILYRLEEYLWTTDNQFGFKAGHSTDLCVYALTEFIEYFKDDICIVSLSSSGLQHLLNICSDYCERHDLTFNAKKSMCMYFSTSINKHCGLPVIYLGNCECQFVNEVKYLGVMIHSSMKTTIDVTRQTKKFYMQANLLLRNFRHCSDDVKCSLFQTYCTNMYCCQLWFNSTKSSINKLSTSYNSVLRRLLCISKPYSASNMFVSRGIPSFAELLRKSIYRFTKRIEVSSNSIIAACLSPLLYISSPVRKWWSSVLYVN